jgi:hypothetical protein
VAEFRNYQAGILPAGPGARELIEFVDGDLAEHAATSPNVTTSDQHVLNLLTKRSQVLHLGTCARVVNDQCGQSGGDASEPHQGTSRRWNTLGCADELPRLRRGLLHEDPRMAGDVLDLLDRAVLRRGTIY